MPRHPDRSSAAAGLSDRVYTRLAERARASGRPIHPLNVGDTYLDPIHAARAEAQRSEEHPRLHNYAPVQGEHALRKAFAERVGRRHGLSVDLSEIQVVSGATAGLSVVAQALLDPGDEVLLPSPFWPLIRGIIAGRGAAPVEIPIFTRLSEASFDLEATLEAKITERTVAIYVNSPNNPTGAILGAAAIDTIVRIAERHDLWIIADEAYEELYFDARPPASWSGSRARERTVVAHTLSKSHALAGARVGFVHGPEGIMDAIRGVQTFLTYCAPRPMQLGAVHALRKGDAFVQECRELYAEAAAKVADATGAPCPPAGTFLFFDASPFLDPEEETSERLLIRAADAGVILTPGAACGEDFGRWVRLCFTAVAPPGLDAAIDTLAEVFEEMKTG